MASDRPVSRRSLVAAFRHVVGLVGSVGIAMILYSQQADPSRNQDAAQYRMNLETGLYSDGYSRSINYELFALLVRTVSFGVEDQKIFEVIGIGTAALYLLVAMSMRAPLHSRAIILGFILLPTFYFNYTELYRQGVALALVIAALTLGTNRPWGQVALIAAGGMHQVLAPFCGFYYLRKANRTLRKGTNSAKLPALRIAIALAAYALLLGGVWMVVDNAGSLDYQSRYFGNNEVSARRMGVSSILLLTTLIFMRIEKSELRDFTTWVLASSAIAVLVVADLTRTLSLITPLVVFASLAARNTTQRNLVLGVVFILGIYVATAK